ncbi:hypothetical protein QAD02_022058 [Eretmocerus hayati]|uniref:Uncharacterized protein n=1 Tax=Eretmocerus hayati TaxID=131215 RepID=A0ACC2PSH5_9HYME|nr:hypothetical protein QAD02_022058 [Eretmocerus hayati]
MIKLIVFVIILQGLFGRYVACPSQCDCRNIKAQKEWLRVVCKAANLEDIKDIDFSEVSIEMIHLDLSDNDLSMIKVDTFKNFSNLKRLNLSANKIRLLDEEVFEGLINLERLDLSNNLISTINSHVFRRVPNLKKLKLNGNRIRTLQDGTFHELTTLQQLDVSNNPWHCDCNLFWFSIWIQNSSIKSNSAPECSTPEDLQGKLVKKLKILKEYECKLTTPSIEILPDQNQVVFAGDTMTIKCRAPSITNDKHAKLNWLWNSNVTADSIDVNYFGDAQKSFPAVRVENKFLEDSGIVASSLSIEPVDEQHSGQWYCILVSEHGNASRAINVIVISNRTQYCPLTTTKNNKGVYAWPRTVVGWKVELPCQGSVITYSSNLLSPRASYECKSTSQWENLDTESCPYVSATTKILEQFATVNISLPNLSLPKGSLLETIKKLKNITGEGASLTDPVEVHFVTQILENYASYLVEEKDLGTMLIDVVNVLLNLPKAMLRAAELKYNACSRLVQTIEHIVEVTPPSQLIQVHKKNMALEEYRLKADNFAGLTCIWYMSDQDLYTKLLHCSMSNKTVIVNPNNSESAIEASIHLPATLLGSLQNSVVPYHLMVSMYADNKLFPKVNEQDSHDVTSSIAGGKLIKKTIQNLTEPVYIMLKAPPMYYPGSRPKPVVWDPSLYNNSGGWTSDGCYIYNYVNNFIIFHCDRLGYYGLLQDTSYFDKDGKNFVGAKFRYSNPSIYVGSSILMLCLICTTMTYICCSASIAMPKKAKHCIVNTWISLISLCLLYTFGIQQTENVETCQAVGISLHYLSLCCILWMTVSANNMYKRLSKSMKDPITDDDELHEQPIRKPILGLYLAGWGIALIICGISGSVNLREYASYSYCFLSTPSSLATLIVPAAILLVYLNILHMLIRCTIRNIDVNGQLSEGTQATENVDLELLEPNPNIGLGDRLSNHSSQTVSSEVEDQEHSQMTQLKGQIIVMVLYLLAWASAAMTTSNLFEGLVPYEETIFAILYAVFTTLLGSFTLLFYGIARSDVRGQWLKMRCWLKQKKNRCCRGRNVCDANSVIPAQSLVPLTAPTLSNSQATQVISDTNSLGSSRHTHKSQSSCNTSKIITNDPSRCQMKPNLLTLHRQQYRSNNSVTTFNTESAPASVEMFYNPHQSGVARKFFKRQRRSLHKNSNLGPRKQGDGGATSDNGSCVSIPRRAVNLGTEIERSLGSSAKVNNTNIHVEINPVNDLKNVNILSDSGGSVCEDRNIALRYVIGQENLDKTSNSRKIINEPSATTKGPNRQKYEPMASHATCTSLYDSDSNEVRVEEKKQMRTVSQQCSLECNSEQDSNVQVASERSEHDLSDISEMAMSRSTVAGRRSSADETLSVDRSQTMSRHRSYDMSNHHSESLSSLPYADRSMSSSRNKRSHRSSLCDATSLESSRAVDDFDQILSRSSLNHLERRRDLLPFPAACIALPTSETKVTSEEDEREENDLAKTIKPLVEHENMILSSETLQLCDFNPMEERNTQDHYPQCKHQFHNCDDIKRSIVTLEENARQFRMDGYSEDTDDITEHSGDLVVKIETSV